MNTTRDPRFPARCTTPARSRSSSTTGIRSKSDSASPMTSASTTTRKTAPTTSAARLTARTRSGFVALRPTMAQPATVLVAVPTTLGTGSESSSVAIADVAGRRRLVSGAHLRPDSCVLLGDAASTLPDPLQREGVVEVLLRLASSFVGDVDGDPLRDALVPTLCRAVIDVLHRDLGDAARHLALRAGALSHHGELPPGNPYGARAWYVGTELSAVLGLRKMAVLPVVTIAAWRLIEAGDERWGSAQRLETLRGQLDASGRTASDWLTGLLQGAGLATTIGVPAATVPALAERILRLCCSPSRTPARRLGSHTPCLRAHQSGRHRAHADRVQKVHRSRVPNGVHQGEHAPRILGVSDLALAKDLDPT